METLLQTVVSGLLTGSLYAMIAIGLTIVFGVMRIINMAHGDMVMLGMFGAYWGYALWKLDPFVSVLLWVPLMFVFGACIACCRGSSRAVAEHAVTAGCRC